MSRPPRPTQQTAAIQMPHSDERHRRRSQSAEERNRAMHTRSTVELGDRLFEVATWVHTRRNLVDAKLAEMTRAGDSGAAGARLDATWMAREEAAIMDVLELTEKAEAEAWTLTARLFGAQSRNTRAREWADWHQAAMTRLSASKRSMAVAPPPVEVASSSEPGAGCRRGGFLERVKLPTFSGSLEDYGEFKCHFRELCVGESYSHVIEIAQLRQKLPREATALICGLTTPDEVWARLDETYGNTDMQALAAVKRLRTFKAVKTAGHDQVIEIANAVQRCVTVLRALKREEDLLWDKEVVPELLQALPVDSQQRWYHRQGPRSSGPKERAREFLAWLEAERVDAVAMHLDALTRRPKATAPASSGSKSAVSSGGTDQSIYNAAHVVQTPATENVTALTQAGDSASRDKPANAGGRVEVTTAEQARQVAAKRKLNLETKKLDKCPICRQGHEYEKTWSQLTPPIKTKMVSTLLTSCPSFLALPVAQKRSQRGSSRGVSPLHVMGAHQAPVRRTRAARSAVQDGGGWSSVWWKAWQMDAHH